MAQEWYPDPGHPGLLLALLMNTLPALVAPVMMARTRALNPDDSIRGVAA